MRSLVLVVVLAACSSDGANNECVGAECEMPEPSSCGNGEVNVATETCDDGNTMDGDGCSSQCYSECGNGSVDGDERCDDGNLAAGDGCDARCLPEAGFTCEGEPSECIEPTGACADPYLITLTNNGSALVGEATGDTTTSTNQVAEADCDFSTTGAGKDHLWRLSLPDRRDVRIMMDATTAFDSAIRLLRIACDLTSEVPEHIGEDGCADYDDALVYTGLPAGTYYVVVDSYDASEAGTYKFYVTASASLCGNGTLDGVEECDDANVADSDGCSATCDVELGYSCDGEPSVCGSACGNGQLDQGEECDDDNTVGGDRCSPTCTLEFDIMEVEGAAQTVSASNHQIRGSLTADDTDLYTFTLTAPATVEVETYDAIDASLPYNGVGTQTMLDCRGFDSELRLFPHSADPTMDTMAMATDDQDGTGSCSYLGPNDSPDLGMTEPMQGVLMPGTYTIKVNDYFGDAVPYYIVDLKISTSGPTTPSTTPLPGDLVLNEFLAADNVSDANCDGVTTGTNDEFIELVNVSSKHLDLSGVTVGDAVTATAGVTHVFADGTMLAPGKAIVVFAGGAPACPGITAVTASGAGGSAPSQGLRLNDNGDTILVTSAAMETLISHTYPGVPMNISSNRSPDVTGTTYVNHDMVTGAAGNYSPGTRADGTPF